MINSKQKGKRGELEWKNQLKEAGFTAARRGKQYSGNEDAPDVLCPELPKIHFEVKRTERTDLYGWVSQASDDAGWKVPVIAHKKNDCEWLVIMRGSDWLDMVKETDHPRLIFCPKCRGSDLMKNGHNGAMYDKFVCRGCEHAFHVFDPK